MSIDPRLISQLLRLQFQSGDPLSGSSTASESTTEFADLLTSLLERPETTGKPANRNDSLLAKSEPGIPAFSSNFALQSLQRSAYGPTKPGAYDLLVEDAALRHGVKPELVKAVIHSESSFNRYAVSSAGAKGLMQLMDGTGRDLGVTDPFDPAQNIDGGTRYLAQLLSKYSGNEATALAAYNAGSGTIDRLGIRTDADLKAKLHLLPKETQQYVENVLKHKQLYG
ncbi:MAG: lytic transglycosylase [Paenibacillus sp.]|jgi:soluble lytic murein transglycosylase-like protein|nr:lytic transglycosylase [Paenibacillus sp.]